MRGSERRRPRRSCCSGSPPWRRRSEGRRRRSSRTDLAGGARPIHAAHGRPGEAKPLRRPGAALQRPASSGSLRGDRRALAGGALARGGPRDAHRARREGSTDHPAQCQGARLRGPLHAGAGRGGAGAPPSRRAVRPGLFRPALRPARRAGDPGCAPAAGARRAARKGGAGTGPARGPPGPRGRARAGRREAVRRHGGADRRAALTETVSANEDAAVRIALYPGSFDPPTHGHLSIIQRGLKLFDGLTVAVLKNPAKDAVFTVDERVELLKGALGGDKRVQVKTFSGLLVKFAQQEGVNTVLRGLRAVSDFEYEFQMANMNRKLDRGIETLFMMTGEDYFYISSRFVRDVARLGGDVAGLVPPNVLDALRRRFGPPQGTQK